MKNVKITFKNDVHNTETNAIAKQDGDGDFVISGKCMHRVYNDLCETSYRECCCNSDRYLSLVISETGEQIEKISYHLSNHINDPTTIIVPVGGKMRVVA